MRLLRDGNKDASSMMWLQVIFSQHIEIKVDKTLIKLITIHYF
jgi:hypothetical protein